MSNDYLEECLAAARTACDGASKARENLGRIVPRLESYLSRHAIEGLSASATQMEVCTTGPNCCKRGSLKLLQDLSAMVTEKSLPLKAVPSGCLRRCSQGPNVQVGGVVYTKMTFAKLIELLDSHVRAKQLSVSLLCDSEYVGDAISCEEKRCRLVLCLAELKAASTKLSFALDQAGVNLPAAIEECTLTQINMLRAVDLEMELAREVTSSSEALAGVVTLEQFVSITLERRLAERTKNRSNTKT